MTMAAPVTALSGDAATLAQVWSAVLGVPTTQLQEDSDFFAMGGHSLLVVRLASEIKRRFAVEVTVKDLFSHSVLQGQLVLLSRLGPEQTQRPALVPQAHDGFVPLSFAQQRLWFIHQLQGGESANYNMPLALRVSGEFDVACAERSLRAIIIRHEVLRSRIVLREGEAWQCQRAMVDWSLTRIDLLVYRRPSKQL